MEGRDRKRWHTADEDKDGTLNKLEFKHFLHPEESDHMRDIVVSETLDDIDKDGDGLISLVIQLKLPHFFNPHKMRPLSIYASKDIDV